MRDSAHEMTEAGLAALGQRRWKDARGLFESAGSSAEALEGLGWAAWWLDDAETTFIAREGAYRAYRDIDDAAGAARVAVWLAGDHVDFRGEMAVASGWLQRAQRLLDGVQPCAEHGWLAFYQAYFALASGDAAAARALAAGAADLGRGLGVPDLEMLGGALEGSALVALAQVGEGMRCLDEAAGTALAGEADFPISIGWTCCFLISACESVGDLGRAWEWCDRVAAFSARHGSAYLHGICRTHYAAMSLWRGDWARAEAELLAAVDDFERSRPPYVGGALAWLAELRRRQGRGEEAQELIARAAGHSRAALCQAQMALDGGDALEAAELAERLLRRWPEDHRMDRAGACALLVRARAERGELDAARAALDELLQTSSLVATPVLRGTARLAEGFVEASRGARWRCSAS